MERMAFIPCAPVLPKTCSQRAALITAAPGSGLWGRRACHSVRAIGRYDGTSKGVGQPRCVPSAQATSPSPTPQTQEDKWAYGAHLVFMDVLRIPISVERFWSAFNDFYDLEKTLDWHKDVSLDSDPKLRGAGVQVSYDLMGTRISETLKVKDDEGHVWQVRTPVPNSIFSFAEGTGKVYQTPQGPEVSLCLDVVLAEQDREKRIDFVSKLPRPRDQIHQIVDYVLERDGKHLEFEFTVDCDIDDLWSVVGNWRNISWVQGAIAVNVSAGPPPSRTIVFPKGETYEVLTKLSDEEKILTYKVERSAGMPVDVLKDTLHLSATPEERKAGCTVVKSSIVLLAKEGLDADEVAKNIKAAFETRFRWVQEKFARPRPEYSPDMYYGKLDTKKQVLHNSTSGTIDAPVDKIWAVLRQFGKMDEWWRDYYVGGITVEPGTADEPKLGQVRSFETMAHTKYKEELVELNDVEHRVVYSLMYMDSGILTGAVTTIDLHADATDSEKTVITWTSAFTLAEKYYAVGDQICRRQRQAYDLGIQSLQRYFRQPEGGIMKASVTEGSMNTAHCDYLLVTVGRGIAERIALSRKGAPKISKVMNFQIADMKDRLTLRVMDDLSEWEHRQMGSGSVDLEDLRGKTNYVIPIRDRNGIEIGRFTLSVMLESTHPSAEEKAQNLAQDVGKVAIMFGAELYGNIKAIVAGMSGDVNAKWEYANYGAEYGPLPTYCKTIPASEAINPARSGQLFQRFQEFIYAQILMMKALSDPSSGAKMVNNDPYAMIFRGWVQKPEKVIERWTHDDEICAQLIRGVNPMKITAVTNTANIPSGFESLKDDSGRGLDDLISARSLFCCDYFELMHGDYNEDDGSYTHQARLDIIGSDLGPRKYWYAPVLLMYKRKDSGKLSILGFQLTRHKSKPNETYSKATHSPNTYQLAKLHLTCADNQHHQFATHLGLTHLLMEPFAMALHNAFPVDTQTGTRKRHPIAKMLEVHFHDTVGINFLARQTLVSDVAPFTDATFSPGTKTGMKIFSTAYQGWDFIGSNFVNDLRNRGFDEQRTDGLSEYYYRDDGFKLWNAFKRYVESVVDALYAKDDDVFNDGCLQVWCKEMTGPAGIKSFPKRFLTKSELVETVVSIIFYCSAQHAAVNFPQERYITYMPNRPDSLLTPMLKPAAGASDISHDALAKVFPSFSNVEFQALFGYLLTCPPDNPFSEYSATQSDFPLQWKTFSDDLKAISESIRARNRALEDAGEIPYEYLDPGRLPQSINI